MRGKKNDDLITVYAGCMVYGHGWDSFTDHEMTPAPYGERHSAKCVGTDTRPGCETERHELWSRRSGEMTSRHYVHTTHYKENHFATKADARKHLMKVERERRVAGNVVAIERRRSA